MILGKSVARLVTRLHGNDDGLIIGSLIDDDSTLKPSTVYNIVKCELTGNLILQEVGESAISSGTESFINTYWWQNIETILGKGRFIFLTKEEVLNLDK